MPTYFPNNFPVVNKKGQWCTVPKYQSATSVRKRKSPDSRREDQLMRDKQQQRLADEQQKNLDRIRDFSHLISALPEIWKADEFHRWKWMHSDSELNIYEIIRNKEFGSCEKIIVLKRPLR